MKVYPPKVSVVFSIFIGVRRTIDNTFELIPYINGFPITYANEALPSLIRWQQKFNPMHTRFYLVMDTDEGMFEVASSVEGVYTTEQWVQHAFA